MRVVRWGKGLAVRLPASLVDRLDLKEGDEIEVEVVKGPGAHVGADDGREAALRRVRELRRALPEGWKFDRDEANAR